MADNNTEQKQPVTKDGKTLIKHKESGNVYFVKKVNDEKHEVLSKDDLVKLKKSGKVNNKGKKTGSDEVDVEKEQKRLLRRIKRYGASEPKDKTVRAKIRKVLESNAEQNGHEVIYRKMFGSTYLIGVDPYGTRTVYDWDGKEYDVESFKRRLKERRKLQSRLNNIHKNDLYLKSIDKEKDAVIAKAREKGEIKYEFLTDNQDLRRKLTRSYPTVEHNGRKLIVGGRFKGHYLEDMINQAGRHVAGTGYFIDTDGKARTIEYKDEDGSGAFRVKHEPYATVNDDGNLNIIIPWGDSERGTALRKLAGTFKELQNVGRNSWVVPPESFQMVNEALDGMAMSETASSLITDMIEQKKRQIHAENNKNYSHINPKEIRGFKHDIGGREWDFMSHQKKAIDVVSKSKRGTTIGFGTGGGKTLTAIGILQSWRNDGTLKEDGKNGRALIVAEPSLKGNFPGEVSTFLEDSQGFLQDVDVVSYDDFRKNAKKYAAYGAIVFDEAQKLRSSSSKVGKAARMMQHPRKINLTASMLEKSPMDLFNLIDISQDISDKDPKVRRREKLKFLRTFCDTVGGKVVGLKNDVTVKRKFRDWVRSNSLYMDKTQVSEIELPPVTPPENQTVDISMEGPIKDAYDQMSAPIRDTLKRMSEKYKQGDLKTTELNQELSRVMGQLQKLRDFSNNPDNYVKGARNPKVDRTVDYVKERLSANDGSKTITFTDNPELSQKTGKELSTQIPYKKHVVGLAGRIEVWQNGEMVDSYTAASKLTNDDGKPVPKQDWQVHLIKKFQKSGDFSTFNLTSSYARGHNIQSADAVVHLDRDSWNNETMKQRTARSWRTGQKNPVDVKIFDLTLDSGDSINEIQKYSMDIERKLFDELITNSFKDEFKTNMNISNIKNLVKNRDTFEFMMNPTVRSSVSIENANIQNTGDEKEKHN